jgi:hypothetical protein
MKIYSLLCLALHTFLVGNVEAGHTKKKLIKQARLNCNPLYKRELNSCVSAMGNNYRADCTSTAKFKVNICIKGQVKKGVKKYKRK